MSIEVVKQKPVAYMDDKGYIWNSTTNPELYTPLYTAPPQREWVGLTEDEVMQEWFSVTLVAKQDLMKFAKAIEAKLKEKNSWQSVANPTEWLDDLRGGADE